MSAAARSLCGLLFCVTLAGCAPTHGGSPTVVNSEPAAFAITDASPIVVLEPVVAPLVFPQPPDESADLNGENIAIALPSELDRLAKEFAASGNFALAVRYQFWYVRQTGVGRFDLARYYAGCGAADASLYWLHAAAQEEGVNLDDVAREEAFRIVLGDPRWPSVRSFLNSSSHAWEMQGKPETTLLLPHGYKKDRGPLWVVVWLHDAGSQPRSLVDPHDEDTDCRYLADSLNIAFVGISGTTPRGRAAYAWADDPERDFERVNAALAEVSKRVAIQPAGVVALGTGQGARTALELSARHPDIFAGAVAFSPGKSAGRLVTLAAPSPLLARRGFIIASSDGESQEERTRSAADAAWFEMSKSRVTVENLAGNTPSPVPLHFVKSFPNWLRIVQSAQSQP